MCVYLYIDTQTDTHTYWLYILVLFNLYVISIPSHIIFHFFQNIFPYGQYSEIFSGSSHQKKESQSALRSIYVFIKNKCFLNTTGPCHHINGVILNPVMSSMRFVWTPIIGPTTKPTKIFQCYFHSQRKERGIKKDKTFLVTARTQRTISPVSWHEFYLKQTHTKIYFKQTTTICSNPINKVSRRGALSMPLERKYTPIIQETWGERDLKNFSHWK